MNKYDYPMQTDTTIMIAFLFGMLVGCLLGLFVFFCAFAFGVGR